MALLGKTPFILFTLMFKTIKYSLPFSHKLLAFVTFQHILLLAASVQVSNALQYKFHKCTSTS